MQLHGHAQYAASDFGLWSCRWCMHRGDEYGPAPQDVPCRTVDQYVLVRRVGLTSATTVRFGTAAEVARALAALPPPGDHEQYEIRMQRRQTA